MRIALRWLCFLAGLACAAPAAAQIALTPAPHIETLDVTFLNAQTVVIGSVADFQRSPSGSWQVGISVSETLKGRQGARVSLELPQTVIRRDTSIQYEERLDAWSASSARLLIAVPAAGTASPLIIDLSDPELAVMTADLDFLKTPDAVIAAARDVSQRASVVTTPATFGVTVDVASVAGTALDTRRRYSLPSDFLFADVPVDARLERRAREQLEAAERQRRLNGIEALGLFSSAANLALLRPLLDDEDWQDQFSDREEGRASLLLRVQYNVVRRQAYASLRRMGANVGEPETSRPRDRDAQVIAAVLDQGEVTSEDVRNLQRYSNLEDLYLSSQSLTDDSWAVVAGLSSLRALFLEGSNVGDTTLRWLSGLPHLRYLGLGNTRISDAGLTALAAMPELKKVDLGQGVTDPGIAMLRQRRPDMNVRLDEFAFLAPLRPRRIEQRFLAVRNSLLPVGIATPAAAGLRAYVLVFPPETADQVDAVLRRELASRGWQAVNFPGYRRDGVPIVLPSGTHQVDQVFLNPRGRDWPFTRPSSGERHIVVARNVNPRG